MSIEFHWRWLLFGWLLSQSMLVLGQEPIDLFSDAPALAPGFVRIGAWNVRHLNVETSAESYFAGRDREADFEILTASIAKSIRDLQLDLVVLVEVQPRAGEPDRLQQVREHLAKSAGPCWRSDVTHIDYDEPDDPFGNLQFGVLWNAGRGVQIDPAQNRVLDELRQPRGASGELLVREHRASWLIPVTVQTPDRTQLEFDLLALHLKSGGGTPQSAEVESVVQFVRGHQAQETPRHLIVCGDWNIRPDENEQGRGRSRLLKMTLPDGQRSLMRLLTVGDIGPDLQDWAQLQDRVGELSRLGALARILPYTHIGSRADSLNSLLDHIAISRTMDEVFDHPLQVLLANGTRDLRPGIEIVDPLIPHADYLHFTDHLPVVLTLRVNATTSDRPVPHVRIVAIEPNPLGDESLGERVMLTNRTSVSVDLNGWRIQDAAGNCWTLDRQDSNQVNGKLARGRSVVILRRGRPMALSNSGDTISLLDAAGNLVDTKQFGPTRTGERVQSE